jgi:hypothetical protein
LPGLEKIGVEAVVEGFSKFMSDLQKAETQYDKFTLSISDSEVSMKAAGSATEGLGTAAAGAAAGPAALAVAAGLAAVKIGEKLVQALGDAINAMKQFTAESMQLAGGYQEMEFTALAVGRAMGLTEQEIRGGIQALNEAGIRYDVAAKTVAQFARNQIDLAYATDLARIAQATGIIVNEDSSATMERLTWAITTGNTTMLRRMGIMADNEAMEEAHAASIGKTTDALTQQEKTQARINGIIEQSASLLDVYTAAMESPTKALRSFTGRVLPEMKAAFGSFFLPAWKTAIDAISNFVEALHGAMQEGGSLYPVLVNLGAIASILADAFKGALDVVSDFISGVNSEMTGGMMALIENMLRFGVELVASFAQGIVDGLDYLIQAMNAIGDMLSAWLAPGSPPKVAPDLVKWGVDAMAEYLRGFTKADFSVLESVQGPLKQLLSSKDFADVSADLIAALGGGEVGAGFYDRIRSAAGEFGDEIAELARQEIALADAVRDVEDSEKRLNDARKAIEDAQGNVAALTDEYNDLLRAGASDEVLDQKLAEINAAEDAVTVAQRQATEAEAANEAAKDRVAVLQEQLDVQRKLVDQLIALNKAWMPADAAEKVGNVAKAIKGLGGEMQALREAMPTAAQFDISSRIGDAIEEAKKNLKAKVGDIFAPLIEKWEEIKEKVGELKEKFEEFKEIVVNTWEKIKTKVEAVKTVLVTYFTITLPDAIKKLIDKLTGTFGLKKAFTKVHDYVRDFLLPKIKELIRDGLEKMKSIAEDIAESWTEGGDFYEAMKSLREYIVEKLIPIFSASVADSLVDVMLWFKDHVLIPVTEAFDKLVGWIKQAVDWVNDLTGKLKKAIDLIGDLPFSPFGSSSTNFSTTGLVPAFSTAGPQYITTSNQMTVGPNYVTNGIEMAALEAVVERVLVKAVRGY